MNRLSRQHPQQAPAAPVRIVHLGIGNFFRAHAAWYTDRAPDAAQWGIAAFTGRRPDAAEALAPQEGRYALITKAADGDSVDVISSIVAVHRSDEHEAFLGYLADPAVAVVTLTVTEAGYRRAVDGAVDLEDPTVAGDVAALREHPRATVASAPMKLVAGALARRTSGAGPVTIASCDNLPDNGAAVRAVVLSAAAAVDPSLVTWVEENVDFASSMVDRITPATTDGDREVVRAALGVDDASPVPTEPFSEWVISGAFPAGRPRWEDAGAQLVDDVEPHERRKLWLLNGSHTLLAYAGSILGHATIDDAIADPACRGWVDAWWAEAQRHLGLPDAEVTAYTEALLERYANPRVRHLTAQIAYDGSQKLPVRTVPVVRAELDAGRVPTGGATTLAAWVLHLRGHGAPVHDATVERAQAAATSGDLEAAVPAVLALLGLEDERLTTAVLAQAAELVAAAGLATA